MSRSIVAAIISLCLLGACDKPHGPASEDDWAPEVHWNEASRTFEFEGRPASVIRQWGFLRHPIRFSGDGVLISPVGNGMKLVNVAPTPILRSPAGLSVPGGQGRLLLVRLTRLKGGGHWNGSLYYSTEKHGESARFRNLPLRNSDPPVNETVIFAYDMVHPLEGGDDWTRSKIEQFRLDTDGAGGGEFVVHQIAIVEDPRFLH